MEDNWVSVDDNLPDAETVVLVFIPFLSDEAGLRSLGYIYNVGWYQSTKPFKGKVTHWQPLPEPPKNKHL
jgi:hypothetical protein